MLEYDLSYDRIKHLEYLNKLVQKNNIEFYQKEILRFKKIRDALKEEQFDVEIVIDQDEDIYYIDLMFSITETKSIAAYFKANYIINALNKLGINCNISGFYYNQTLKSLMYTAVAVEIKNGPSLYEKARDTIYR